jgi:hypothetical protein
MTEDGSVELQGLLDRLRQGDREARRLLLERACERAAAEKVTFDKDVKPIFKKHCVSCHNSERPRGDLDLSAFAGVMTGACRGRSRSRGSRMVALSTSSRRTWATRRCRRASRKSRSGNLT